MNLALPVGDNSQLTPDKDWWRGAVIYQIYPRSYQDSNGDGIGDLAGIIHRLPYIASLGVDAIWISPFFKSPMLDFGYDVSDYRDVDPMFGTLGDFDALIEQAHGLGLRVMIDLVLSHSSDKHAWFQESRTSRENPKANWYVWADPKPDGTPPTNWLSIFGGSAWAWDGDRKQYYLHNFLTTQPDLNFHEAEVQDAVLDVARFWLERGVDGFRLDTINFYVHDKELRDNPALPEEERNASIAPDVNPYNFQDHLFDKNQPENVDFLRRLRTVMDEFPDTAAVGEVGDAQYGLKIIGDYTAGDDLMHMCYAFDFLSPEPLSGTRAAKVLGDFEAEASEGWACWAFSNHDVSRHRSRWHLGEDAAKLHAALILSLKGSVCLYQGEELGLTEAYVSYEDLQDPYGKQFWPKYKGRDGCRTPMVWSSDGPNGGFTDGKPWLPVAMEHLENSVSAQENQPASMLNFYRDLLRFRKAHPVLSKGSLTILEATDERLVFIREHQGQQMYCAFSLSEQRQKITLPDTAGAPIEDLNFDVNKDGDAIILGPFQAYFAHHKG